MRVLRFIVCTFLFLPSCNSDNGDIDYLSINHGLNVFSNNRYYYHFAPNYFIKDGENRKAIASESIEDIELSARLGFKFIEANIWETSDGQYVCIHGSNGTFGPEVYSIDSSIITTDALRNTKISSVSLDWIKRYVRYDSDYEEYQTTIPSLEEFCLACKQNQIGILAGVGEKKKPVEICVKYLAEDVVIYGPPANIRDYYKGYLLIWNNSSGVSRKDLLKKAQSFGPPYICSIGDRVISELEDREELCSFIDEMHNKGFLVGWASVYSTELDSMRYLRMGMDISGSGHEVNGFESNYEYYNIADINHLPNTTGDIVDGVIELSRLDSVICGSDIIIPVGKGSLTIRFKGTIRLSFGSMGSSGDRYELKSDGEEPFVFTDFFFHNHTLLTIESLSENTTVSHLVYVTTIC